MPQTPSLYNRLRYKLKQLHIQNNVRWKKDGITNNINTHLPKIIEARKQQ